MEKRKTFISGKGGSYGQEILTLYKMKKMFSSIKKYILMKNNSWKNEINDFYKRIIKRIFK